MAEKKGNTLKLKYDFNESLCCEVEVGNNRARVTGREFRSWNGIRYLQGNPYDGPIYYYGTNEIVENPNIQGILFKGGKDPRDEKRPRSYTSF